LILITLNGCTQKQETIKIGYLPVVHSLPLYVAIEKGYFEDEGIIVEAISFESPNQLVDAIMQGQLDFGSAMGTGIIGIANSKNPGKVKIYAVSGEMNNNCIEEIVIPLRSTITSIAELKGKKFGILAGTIQWRTIARDILTKNGLNMDTDVTIVELPGTVQTQTMASGQVDALLALEPIPTTIIQTGVGKILMQGPAKEYIADPFWPGADVVNLEFAIQNPETTEKIIAILQKTIDEINENPEEYKKYLKTYTPLTDEIIAKVSLADYKTCNDLTAEDIAAINTFYNIFTIYGVVDDAITIEPLLYC